MDSPPAASVAITRWRWVSGGVASAAGAEVRAFELKRRVQPRASSLLGTGGDLGDPPRRDAVAMETGNGGLCGFRQDSNQQAAGSLRVEEKIAVFLRNAFGKTYAIANKIPVIFQAAGEKPFACGLQRSGKIANGGMIDLEGHGFDSAGRITKRHLSSVA